LRVKGDPHARTVVGEFPLFLFSSPHSLDLDATHAHANIRPPHSTQPPPLMYGGQDWTVLCLVLAEQRHVEAIKLPYGEDVLDNFYLHENVDRFFDIFGSRGGDEEHANAQEALV